MSSPCDTAWLVEQATEIGIDRIGVADAVPVPEEVTEKYERWLAAGGNAGMEYLERYSAVRKDPGLLLEGASSVISCAVSYYHTGRQPDGVPAIASYAHGDDYHEVVRRLLEELASRIRSAYGGETRVCVDTAPVHERYWAVASGVGFRGRSGLVIVPGSGTCCFLAEIITTVRFGSTAPLATEGCEGCGKCIRSCPGQAINPDGTVSASRCLSYLTIEHRGDLPEGLSTAGRLYGCDTCQTVCPYNQELVPCRHPEFDLRPAYRDLTAERIASLSHEEYTVIFRHSAIKRAKLSGLQRNLRHL